MEVDLSVAYGPKHPSVTARAAHDESARVARWSRDLLQPMLLQLSSGFEQARSHIEGAKAVFDGTLVNQIYTTTKYMAGLLPDELVQLQLQPPQREGTLSPYEGTAPWILGRPIVDILLRGLLKSSAGGVEAEGEDVGELHTDSEEPPSPEARAKAAMARFSAFVDQCQLLQEDNSVRAASARVGPSRAVLPAARAQKNYRAPCKMITRATTARGSPSRRAPRSASARRRGPAHSKCSHSLHIRDAQAHTQAAPSKTQVRPPDGKTQVGPHTSLPSNVMQAVASLSPVIMVRAGRLLRVL